MKIVKIDYYMERMQQLYPDLKRSQIEKIIKEGCANITDAVVNGHNVNLDNKILPVKMTIYKPWIPKKKINESKK